MNSIKDRLDNELGGIDFEIDTQTLISIEKTRKKKLKRRITAISAVCVAVVLTTSVLFAHGFGSGTNSSENNSGKSFFIRACAAENLTQKPFLSTIDSINELRAEDMVLSATCLGVTYYVRGAKDVEGIYDGFEDDEELKEIFNRDDITINKSFYGMGDNALWVDGNGVVSVEYISENSSFYMWNGDVQSNRITLDSEDLEDENNVVVWMFPEGTTEWMEEQNETNEPVDFLTAPTDTVTINVTFEDGSKSQRKLKLYFNKDGYLVVETEDGTKYNDGNGENYKDNLYVVKSAYHID